MATNKIEEIEEETTPLLSSSSSSSSSSKPEPTLQRVRSVTTKVPESELHVYKQGKGPIEVFKTPLGGWDQDQLDVREILDRFGFKSVYAFGPGSGRGVPIRFNARNGRSLLTYSDGAVIYLDGEPKDSLINPITKIILGVALITCMIVFVMKETPQWAKKLNFSGSTIPPWVLACAVILFTRLRKRTKSFLGNSSNHPLIASSVESKNKLR